MRGWRWPGWTLWAVLCLAWLLAGACGGKEGDSGKAGSSGKSDTTKADSVKAAAAKAGGKGKADEGVPVKAERVGTGSISSYLLFSSTVESERAVDIFPDASGLVEEVRVEEGQFVKAGEVLVRLQDKDAKLSAADAEARFRKMESDFQRTMEMHNRQLISNQDFETKRFEFKQAEIGWEKAKLALDQTGVRSPISGVVADRMVKLGDRVGPSVKLCSVVDMDALIVKVFVPGREVQHTAVGQPAILTSDFLPGAKFAGRIKRISPVVDPTSGTFKVTVGVSGGDGKLKPGMLVNAHLVTDTHEDAVLVPKRAVVYDDGLPYVFVVRDTVAVRVALKIAFSDGERMEVESGLARGDSIVVVGEGGLKDKTRICVISGDGLLIPEKPDSLKDKE